MVNERSHFPRKLARSCLKTVIGAVIVIAVLNIGFHLYVKHPIPSRRIPVLKGNYFWDEWRVKRYLRSWGIKAEDWLDHGIVPVKCIICNEVTKTCALDLKGEKIDHLEWCNGLNISSLNVSGSDVSDIAPLAQQTNLLYLNISGTRVSDLSPLASMTNSRLSGLSLDDTPVSDLAPLAEWARNTCRPNPRLHTLSIRNTKVADLSPLKDIDIERLFLDGIPCDDLSPVRTNFLSDISFLFEAGKEWKGTEHIRACTNVAWVNMRRPSLAWFQFDYFHSGEADQSRYASIRDVRALMVALDRDLKARGAAPKGDALREKAPFTMPGTVSPMVERK